MSPLSWLLAVVAFASRMEFQSRCRRKAAARSRGSRTADSADSSRYFDSKNITKQNVQQLQVAWSYPYGETVFHPIVVHGTIYGRGRNGSLVALDARTGKELWVREGMQAMTTRGMNYWESKDGKDRRLIFSMNDYLQEIDATTGKSILDVRQRRRRRSCAKGSAAIRRSIGRVQSGTPGQVFENLILLGSAPGEGYMSAPGDLRAYDVITGKLVWTFHTVPHPGEFGYDTWPKDAWKYIGGTNTWGEIIDRRKARHRVSSRPARRPTTTTAPTASG